jgi:hypothetical protein
MARAGQYYLERLLDAAQHALRRVLSDQTIHGPFVEVLQLIELPGRTREARNHQDSGFRVHGVSVRIERPMTFLMSDIVCSLRRSHNCIKRRVTNA